MNFEEIYEHFFRDVYLYVLALSGNPHIAEEITQETFFKAMKGLKSFRGECSVKSWLCQIAKNQYISYMRKNKYLDTGNLEAEPDSKNVEVEMIRKEEVLSIYKILHVLDEPYKEVFTLRVLGELSFREIGDIFGKQEAWARVTYHRSRLKIREAMKENGDTK